MSALSYRPMAWTDIPRLVQLDEELFGHHAWAAPTWWAELAGRPRREYRVGELDGQVVAYAGVDHGGDVADVMTIAVAPAARGSGAGDELVSWMRSQAVDGGAEALLLEVRDDNVPARKLYDRNGFEQISVRRRYYQPDGVDAIIMRARLS